MLQDGVSSRPYSIHVVKTLDSALCYYMNICSPGVLLKIFNHRYCFQIGVLCCLHLGKSTSGNGNDCVIVYLLKAPLKSVDETF